MVFLGGGFCISENKLCFRMRHKWLSQRDSPYLLNRNWRILSQFACNMYCILYFLRLKKWDLASRYKRKNISVGCSKNSLSIKVKLHRFSPESPIFRPSCNICVQFDSFCGERSLIDRAYKSEWSHHKIEVKEYEIEKSLTQDGNKHD